MTDKELKRKNRRELLELLFEQSQENDRLREQLKEAEEKLSDRQLQIDKAGSIAEAALQINQVFESAQSAAEQYLENIKQLSNRQEQVCQQMEEEASAMLEKTKKCCQTMEEETAVKCASMTRDAQKKAEQTVATARSTIYQIIDEQASLRELINSVKEGN